VATFWYRLTVTNICSAERGATCESEDGRRGEHNHSAHHTRLDNALETGIRIVEFWEMFCAGANNRSNKRLVTNESTLITNMVRHFGAATTRKIASYYPNTLASTERQADGGA
jgi:hypothetical protein